MKCKDLTNLEKLFCIMHQPGLCDKMSPGEWSDVAVGITSLIASQSYSSSPNKTHKWRKIVFYYIILLLHHCE